MKIKMKRLLLILTATSILVGTAGCSEVREGEESTTEEPPAYTEDVSSQDTYFNFSIPVKNINTEEAKSIVDEYDLPIDKFTLEYTDENDSKKIVYNNISGVGIDSDGLRYDAHAQPLGLCPCCEKSVGVRVGMCDGSCNVKFQAYGSVSIMPESTDSNFETSK